MSKPAVFFYDDATARRFEPFARTRPLSELRVGALLVRERWSRVLAGHCGAALGFIGAPHLSGFSEFSALSGFEGILPAGSWVVNSRALPHLNSLSGPLAKSIHHAGSGAVAGEVSSLLIDQRVAAVRLREDSDSAIFASGELELEQLPPESSASQALASSHWLKAVWDTVGFLNELLVEDLPALAASLNVRVLKDNAETRVLGEYPVLVEEGAVIEPMVVLDASAGPLLLRKGSLVQSFSRVSGPLYLGHASHIIGGSVRGSSIGDGCRIRGEMSACTIVGNSNKGHDGFVGHSVIGRWVNLGAGTITSNLKNTYGNVALWTPEGQCDTGMQFLGTMFGDHAKTGIGMRLTTGCVVGAGANLFGNHISPKLVPPFAWGDTAPFGVHAVDKFVQTAKRMMARRNVQMNAVQEEWWRGLHATATAGNPASE